MMKKLLIISPYFPPVNAADMQRVRMSLPYFKDYGWEAEVVCVDPEYIDMAKDDLLLQSVSKEIPVHAIKAFSKKYTAKIGLGSIALRSMWFYRQKVNRILRHKKFDLIYFSTTQFPVCVLGRYWKKKFGIPYVIDMQDPWHNDYYRDKPKSERPPKYWFSYRLNKWLEPLAMKKVDGLISVSNAYINTLKNRYPEIKDIPTATIPFAAFNADWKIAEKHQLEFPDLLNRHFINIVYIGRGGKDMHRSATPLFAALKQGLKSNFEQFKNLRIHFLGTSYAPAPLAKPTLKPLADEMDLSEYVIEQPSRIGFYHTLSTLRQADALFVPGSDDAAYTASKIYPYIMAKKPLLAIFHKKSNVINILKICTSAQVITLNETADFLRKNAFDFLDNACHHRLKPIQIDMQEFKYYLAQEMTKKQIALFNKALKT